ncbi:MAG TPA: hypothetical protein VFT14_04795 [Solirubrobacterales bacterium]|nr:hypothetical protein [Solirubrobacterales bacterium]
MKAAKWGLTIGLALAALALAACGGDDDGGDPAAANEELFTTAGFQQAYDGVTEEAGEGAQVLQVQITSGGASFKLRSGEQATGFVYTDGELHDQEVEVIGPGSLEGTDFPISEVDPAAIDRIVEGVRSESGVSGIEPTVMTLEKGAVDGELRWTVNAEGGGRSGLVYTADPDGSNVTSPLGGVAGGDAGGGSTTLPGGKTPAEIAQCVQEAQGDVAKIQACAE